MPTQATLLRRPDVMRMTGLCRSALYDLISKKRFPLPVRLTERAVAWRASEVQAWIVSRPSARTETPADAS